SAPQPTPPPARPRPPQVPAAALPPPANQPQIRTGQIDRFSRRHQRLAGPGRVEPPRLTRPEVVLRHVSLPRPGVAEEQQPVPLRVVGQTVAVGALRRQLPPERQRLPRSRPGVEPPGPRPPPAPPTGPHPPAPRRGTHRSA